MFSGKVKRYKDFACNYFLHLFSAFQNDFLNNKTYFVALFNADFQIALLDQLTSTNSCLLMHPILLRINLLKYNSGKRKSILVSQDVRIIKIPIIGLYFIWKNSLTELTKV